MSRAPLPGPGLADRLAPWREAWRIRRAHPRWAVQWVAADGQYRAFRLSRQHRDAVLAAATPEDLTAQIEHAEQTGKPGTGSEPGRSAGRAEDRQDMFAPGDDGDRSPSGKGPGGVGRDDEG